MKKITKKIREGLEQESKKGELLKDLITTDQRDFLTAEMDKLGGMLRVLERSVHFEDGPQPREMGFMLWDMNEKFDRIQNIVRKVI